MHRHTRVGYPQEVITLIRLFGMARKLKSLFPGQGKIKRGYLVFLKVNSGNRVLTVQKSGYLVFLIVNSENRVLTLQIDQVEHPEQLSCVESCKFRKTFGITTFCCKSDVIILPKNVDYRQNITVAVFKLAPAHSAGVNARSNHANSDFGVAQKLKSLFPGQVKGLADILFF